MHTLWLFFSWPQGGAWSNIVAVPPCAVLAAVLAFVFRDHLGRALSGFWHRHFGHRDELDALTARMDAHADLLNPDTPGGMAAVMTELRDLKATVEATAAGIETLASIAKPTPRAGGKTPMRRAAGAKEGSDGKTSGGRP